MLDIFFNQSKYRKSKDYLVSRNYIFQYSLKEIILKFMEEEFNIENIFEKENEQIIEEYIKKQPIKLFEYSNFDEFLKGICKTYLKIIKEPRVIYNAYMDNAIKDLKLIKENIKYCDEMLNKKFYDNKEEFDINDERKFQYYKKINNEEEESIINFLLYSIKSRTIEECTEPFTLFPIKFFKNTIFDIPYNFASDLFKDTYNPKNINSLEVEFCELSLPAMKTVKSIYGTNEYNEVIDWYINEYQILEKIKYIVKNNYYLVKRSEVLLEAISNYEANKYQVFINIVAIQIEGLFKDYCSIRGISSKDDISSSLVKKLNEIKSKEFFYGYEYFAFEFPKIRNRIAHGNLIEYNDISIKAKEILLDLYYVTNMFDKKDMEYIMAIDLLKENDFTNKEDLKKCMCSMIEYPSLYDFIIIDKYRDLIDFYNMTDKKNLLKQQIVNNKDYVKQIIEGIIKDNMESGKKLKGNIKSLANDFIRVKELKDLGIAMNKSLANIQKKKEGN